MGCRRGEGRVFRWELDVRPHGEAQGFCYSGSGNVDRSDASTARPSRTTISGTASTSAASVWKFTMHARSRYTSRTTALETR